MIMVESEARAQVLLLGAAPRRSRRRLLNGEHGVAAVAAVPTGRLVPGWTGPVDVVQLVDPAEPQAVLARLQAAAAVPGPLLVYLCGQLIRDHRQHQVHLALADTRESTVRYTALPWPWIVRALAERRPGTTTVVVDLVADPSCWPLQPSDLTAPAAVARWGVVAPPAKRGPQEAPTYTVTLAELLRQAGPGQHLPQLHPLAAARAPLAPGSVVLAPAAAEPHETEAERIDTYHQDVADPRPAIAHAMRAGHHHSAAELAAQWERSVLRTAGRESREMGDVLEVQATAAAAAGATVRAAERWVATAEHRLRWYRPGDPAVQLAARNALACWRELSGDGPETAQVGQRLAELLRRAGRESTAAAVEDRLHRPEAAFAPATGRWNEWHG
ncbi:hypothetical protein ACFC26_41320 [Kitasatospora purpeofusca]|uniref:hypothetical protein n=1 Tax=Kitasatospora purpeofusca TaxID=67352 RepID=UPI0035DA0A19